MPARTLAFAEPTLRNLSKHQASSAPKAQRTDWHAQNHTLRSQRFEGWSQSSKNHLVEEDEFLHIHEHMGELLPALGGNRFAFCGVGDLA